MKVTLKGGKLLDPDGNVVGRISGLELELELPDGTLITAAEQPKLAIESADEVREVWAYYCEVMEPRNRKLDQEARAVIRKALQVATVEECREAIVGCSLSDFHMKRGEYATRKAGRYNKLSQILKGKRGGRTTREQIDFFLDIARSGPSGEGLVSGDPARIRDAKNDVLAAHEFPDDEHTAQRGRRARRWLESQGWTIGERQSDGWPTFQPPVT